MNSEEICQTCYKKLSKCDCEVVVCTNCSKKFKIGHYEQWCDIIMKHKPACSYKCNGALGQVKRVEEQVEED